MNTSVRFPNLDIDFSFVGRSVSVFGFELTFFGLLTAAGMLLGLAVMIFVAKKQKEDPNLSLEAMIPAFAGGVLGGAANVRGSEPGDVCGKINNRDCGYQEWRNVYIRRCFRRNPD